MTSSSIPLIASADLTPTELRQILRANLTACRQSTLGLINVLTDAEFSQQAHPDFSPVGWHLGHIAFTESLWLLEYLKRDKCAYPQYQRLFAADGLPKTERQVLPSLAEILTFMETIRDRTLTYLETAPLHQQLRLWQWILQHESQHAEIATYILALHRQEQPISTAPCTAEEIAIPLSASKDNMVFVASGEFPLGHESVEALDNEQPQRAVQLTDYWIDRTPVTVAEYSEFVAAGGYQNSQWWHPQGWHWVAANEIMQPLYWRPEAEWANTPVCGVSWYEADAYACFVGKRLPTEAEWERAAQWQPATGTVQPMPWGDAPATVHRGNFDGERGGVTPVGEFPAGRSAVGCDDMLGNVWEWTSSWFDGYPGFTPYPYADYSQAYFDKRHRVLRGGSWATRRWVLRPTFRNWYQPEVRQLFAGFRCVLSA
ncbi:SUMF1/EgtB/PvdO family nonheme iron enzyme [Oscillatoria sp. CS-180]|uniref:SUMF1/EgtB/PvdO family nonheme iron enzyme n=1 Tax=Oscillatoria sp. CS-180 TaxID=3021720 RepID=UPI002330177D|nr:SUMF1/EgtB/PvdO family nonheme iron enzyme [Oscillatoria sp. CS-180]MDB9528900.1 SUMF1/EgtB/PvdO family nonheme iron enzyme [Oscillatoria sp. CS-180]